jgi:lycopene cyclase domain-containing protein
MTYLQFHLAFILPPLLLLVLTHPVRRGAIYAASAARARWGLALIALVALIYTTPWDNLLVARGIWSYAPDQVLGRIGEVPLEEYLFFILQPLLTGLFLYRILKVPARWAEALAPRVLGAAFWLLVALGGVILLRAGGHGLYAGFILAYFAPVLVVQWASGGDLLLAQLDSALPAILLPTLYLWFCDRLAIVVFGIWRINPRWSSGWTVAGLPLEEMLFFLIVNIAIVQGLLLFLHPQSWERLQHLPRPPLWVLGIALSALVEIPFPLWPQGFPILASLSTLILALAALAYAWRRLGPLALLLAGLTFGLGLALEWVGSHTGWIFGPYRYTAPPPTLLGIPLLVPLGWWGMGLASALLAGGRPLWGGLLMAAWDLGLEPLMTQEGFWRWQGPGIWFGAPWQNFIAWFLIGALLTACLGRFFPPREVGFGWAYRIEGLLLPMGLAILGLWLPALLVGLAMNGLAWWKRPSSAPSSSGP